MAPSARLRIVHLFPDVLRFYGDGGNVRTLVKRADARSITTEVLQVMVGAERIPPADLVLIGGGQDREQVTVARELERLGDQLVDTIGDGAALLAVCGGYQNLGLSYRTAQGVELPCPGLLPITTNGSGGVERLVGPVVAHLTADVMFGRPSQETTVVGFENHSGRTVLQPHARPLARIEIGHGNNGVDGTEGVVALPGDGGLGGLRVGTYLHGPLLPRNPHIADALIAAALGRLGEPAALAPLDDGLEWAAHRAARARLRRTARDDRRIPGWAHRVLDPIRALIGY